VLLLKELKVDVEKIIRENIPNTVHLSLGTSENNVPWVCEVHFAVDEDLNIYWRSKTNRRHSLEIANNPIVAGNIVKQHEIGQPVVGVYFEGTAELLENVDINHPAYVSLNLNLGVNESSIEEAKKDDGHKFYKVTVQNWYAFGRFGADHGQKLKLEWSS